MEFNTHNIMSVSTPVYHRVLPKFPFTFKGVIPKCSPDIIKTSLFKKDVRFGWGICSLSSVAEVLVNPTKSLSLGGSIAQKKVFIEGRHYFGDNHEGSFASIRASSRKNLGFVIGSREETEVGIFSSKIGFSINREGSISPAIGIGWEWTN